jgi:hypothetical protein
MTNQLEIVEKLNQGIALGVEANKLIGFEKAYKLAEASEQISTLLTSEYMVPIMKLQGNKLGFKTDKDSSSGYPEKVVKNCLIEAVLTGVQPVGNQFNIIAGNCYITKEGFGYLLKNVEKLVYEIIPELPNIQGEKAAAKMKIRWGYGSISEEREIIFPIKLNKYMGADAVIGKATRKARAWLYNNLTGTEISDGDIGDVKTDDIIHEEIKTTVAEKKKGMDGEQKKIGMA